MKYEIVSDANGYDGLHTDNYATAVLTADRLALAFRGTGWGLHVVESGSRYVLRSYYYTKRGKLQPPMPEHTLRPGDVIPAGC